MWLVTEGLVVALLGAVGVAGAGLASVLCGVAIARAEAAGVLAVCCTVLYLLATKSGKLLVGAVAVAGVLLALAVPRTTADSVLAESGRRQDVVVTAVAYGSEGAQRGARYFCSVQQADGTPVAVRLRRGCGPSVVPGGRIGMLYDPHGRVPPRGVAPWNPLWPMTRCVLLAAAFATLTVLTVVRSYRLAPAAA